MMEITEEELNAKIEAAINPLKLENEKMAAKNNELLGEVKSTKKKRVELEEAQKQAQDKKDLENGEFEKLHSGIKKQLEDEQASNSAFRKEINDKNISSAAESIAIEVNKTSESNRYLLAREIKDYTSIVDGEIKYTVGGIDVDQASVISHIKEKFPSLVDGNPASGDKTPEQMKPSGSAAGAKKWNELTMREKQAKIESKIT